MYTKNKQVSRVQIEQPDLSKPIYDKVKAMILSQELKPGQKIIQEKLSAQLGVSRTPLAKALQMLEFELLVESKPRRGMYVKDIDLQEMLEVFECREALEGMAARKLAELTNKDTIKRMEALITPFMNKDKKIVTTKYARADEKFHQILIDDTGNKVLRRLFVFGSIHDKIAQMGLVRPPEETLEEHIKIVEAIKEGNGDKAAEAASTHVRRSKELIEKEIQKIDN